MALFGNSKNMKEYLKAFSKRKKEDKENTKLIEANIKNLIESKELEFIQEQTIVEPFTELKLNLKIYKIIGVPYVKFVFDTTYVCVGLIDLYKLTKIKNIDKANLIVHKTTSYIKSLISSVHYY